MKNLIQYSYTHGFIPSTSLEEDFEKGIQINVRTSDLEYRMRNRTYGFSQNKISGQTDTIQPFSSKSGQNPDSGQIRDRQNPDRQTPDRIFRKIWTKTIHGECCPPTSDPSRLVLVRAIRFNSILIAYFNSLFVG